ncbi:MAG: hypothetical protein LBR33_01425 [Propionibacteriaceae bacterium]|jgi:hypothetical protein|nr:hypothetical protein [Propionibacteriaceae bacterium]
MSLTSRLVTGTLAVLLARGAITIVSEKLPGATAKVKARFSGDPGPVAGEAIEVESGHHALKFATVDELPVSVTTKYGDLALDFTAVPVTADAALSVHCGSGALRLSLPANQNWVVAWSVARGAFLAGQERRTGTHLVGRNANTPLPGAPTLTLTVELKNGLLSLG